MSTNLNPLEKVHLWGDTRLARSEAVTEAEVRAVWFEKSDHVEEALKHSGRLD